MLGKKNIRLNFIEVSFLFGTKSIEWKKKMIEQIKIEKLYGHMDYILPKSGALENAAILYGDNGTGKTTILKLVYHMLSPANDKGHRTALSKIPFQLFSIRLMNGFELKASREGGRLVGPCLLQISKNGELMAEWDYVPGYMPTDIWSHELMQEFVSTSSSKKPKSQLTQNQYWRTLLEGKLIKDNTRGEEAYVAALHKIGLRIYLLSADRQISADTMERQETSLDFRSAAMEENFSNVVEKGREISLKAAIFSAWRWIASQAVAGANAGGDSANIVYADIIRRLSRASTKKTNSETTIDADAIVTELKELDRRSKEMYAYRFMAPLNADEIISELASAKKSSLPLLQTVLEPYINGQRKRLEALDQIYEITHRFVSTLNGFFQGKHVVFDLGKGMSIVNEFDGMELEPIHLSSGEQQLLLLFCHTLVSRDHPSVFIIDEPEISLNVKWQRKLVQNLLEVSQGSETQFLFASHSIELLTQHRGKVVEMATPEPV